MSTEEFLQIKKESEAILKLLHFLLFFVFFIDNSMFFVYIVIKWETLILSDGTNHVIVLGAGEEWTVEYNDIANPLYAISDVADQSINAGVIISV